MLHRPSVSLLLATALLSALACTNGGEPQAAPTEAKPSVDAQAPTKPEPTGDPVVEAQPEPPPEPAPVAEVIAEPAPAVEIEPGTVPVSPIVLADATTVWRTAASPSEAVALIDLQAGVLGLGAGGYYDIADDGQLVLRTEIEAPAGQLLGVWPSDTWYIEERVKTAGDDRADQEVRELRLMRLRGNKRWVPQEYAGAQRFEDEGQDFRKANSGGLFALNPDEDWTRVADNGDDPDFGVFKGEQVLDFIETGARKFYVISKDSDHVYVQTDCADEPCVQDKTKVLPLAADWSFGRQATRQRHSASVVAAAASRNFLLHYESGGWKLEEFTGGQADAIWATKDGGLWVRNDKQLLHRDPDGGWRKLGLPEDLTGITVAITEDRGELWIAGMVGAKPAVFATHANAQEPAVELIPG
jgi:hypothetical protein